jgi:SAM-dependent methyltransferase
MRNTDADWEIIAQRAAYYGVLAHPKFLEPSAETLAEFFASGEADIAAILATIRGQLGPFNPRSGLDFGCGPGRQLIPIARETGSAYGLDISQRMLELARQNIATAGVNAIVGKDFPDRRFDWVNSSIVLQHIPPRRGYEILRRLWAAVADGGVLTVHLTIYHDRGATGEVARDLVRYRYDGEHVVAYEDTGEAEVGGMSMYDYDLSRVFAVFDFPHDQRVYIVKTIHGANHGVIIYSRKG